MSSFTKKIIRVTFELAQGNFDSSVNSPAGPSQPQNTKIVENLRVHADIKKGGSPSKNEAVLKIYGMNQHDMQQLSTVGLNNLAVQKNLVQVAVGDSDGLTTAFQGEITGAWVNYHTPPDLDLEVHAISGYFASIQPMHPTSLQGGTPAASIFQRLADQMGIPLQNNGVTAQIQDPYLTGSAYTQALSLAMAVGVEFGIDNGVLWISPRGQFRPPLGQVPLLTPASGMKEYPIWDKQGLVVESLYDPLFQIGGEVQIASSLVERANGPWRIHGLHHNLSSKHPHQASWHTKLHLAKQGV